ncbi:hypothetical protein BD413DRAFT_512739 [Trametes elegans]|nr:hypothetical protein BD413DRAFT_512739 [Trametes elegans]
MAPAEVTVCYTIYPYDDTPLPANNPASRYDNFRIQQPPANSKAYYEGLRAAVLEAKKELGEQLTLWRDAMGKSEDHKVAKKSENDEDEDEDDEDETVE